MGGEKEREQEGGRRREGAPIDMKAPNQNRKYATVDNYICDRSAKSSLMQIVDKCRKSVVWHQ